MSAGLDDAQVEQLARLARLDLGPERREVVLAQLAGLLEEAAAVNDLMADRRDVAPSIRFDAWGPRDGG